MEAISLVGLLALGWFWYVSFQSRAAAIEAARAACQSENFMLLDDTVALTSLRLQRDDEGRLRLRRVYRFEYSDTGDNRRDGDLALFDDKVLTVRLATQRRSEWYVVRDLNEPK
ncbi:MAG TPA: DUF3301 domain-containing protein [Accumulibacter sp.]|nr:DUF3301 domain-containing protein [Accumulibacter sp.]